MIYLLSIPMGIILGLIVQRISLKSQSLAYFVGMIPYSIFFWLTFENREFWGQYRVAAIIATLFAILTWTIKDRMDSRNVKNKADNGNPKI